MRVNIGCGSLPTTGWKNYDNSLSIRIAHMGGIGRFIAAFLPSDQRSFVEFARSHEVEYADVVRRIPLPDESVEVVYSAHMLEHLHPEQARTCLQEVKRILKPGGIIRLDLPDLELLVKDYLAHGDGNAFMEKSMLATPPIGGLFSKLRLTFTGFRHHLWMYDGRSLCRLLSECGYVDPQITKPGMTRIPNPGPLDLAERAEQSVYVEAVKS